MYAYFETFYAPIINGKKNLGSRRCVSDSLSSPYKAYQCAGYRQHPESVRIVPIGVAEGISVSTTPGFLPSCFVSSNIRVPAGTYSVSSPSFSPPPPMLSNGDFESPALSESQTYQNFASGQSIGGWFVSSTSASCFDQSNKAREFPVAPQCFGSVERNFVRRSTFWDTLRKGDCGIYNRLESSQCSSPFSAPSNMHFSGSQSVVIPMGMSLKTTATNLVTGLYYQYLSPQECPFFIRCFPGVLHRTLLCRCEFVYGQEISA